MLLNATDEVYPGDICIFDKNRTPKNGDIVAVEVAPNVWTVKVFFFRSADEVELRTANKFRSYPYATYRKENIRSIAVFVGKIKISDSLKREYGLRKPLPDQTDNLQSDKEQ
jgi:SOS-response transcriptional repressor LexA